MPSQSLTEVKFGDSEQMQPGLGHGHRQSVPSSARAVRARDARAQQSLGGVPGGTVPADRCGDCNSGNWGGLNVRGEVVGMNTAILSQSTIRQHRNRLRHPNQRDPRPPCGSSAMARWCGRHWRTGLDAASDTRNGKGVRPAQQQRSLMRAVDQNGSDKASLRRIWWPNWKAHEKDSDSLAAMVVGTKPGTSAR